jgi:sugar phosphate isomerase/epimerase
MVGLSWCFSTLGCGELGLAEVVRLADRFAIPGIELRGLDGSLDIVAVLGRAISEHPELVAGLVAARRVRGIGTSFRLLDDSPAAREELLACALLADRFACPHLRVFGRGGEDLRLTAAEADRGAATVRWWTGERVRRGLSCRLLVETHDVFSSSENCLALLGRTAGGIEVLWDAHHTWCAAGEDFALTWERLGPLVRHVHVKDSRLHDGKREGTMPGQGDVPIPRLLDLLGRAGFGGPVSLEWERWWEPHLPPLPEALAALTSAGWRR